MTFKKVISILSLSIFLTSAIHVSAAENTPSNHIPSFMNPGTTITFDKNKNMIILNAGENVPYNLNKNASNELPSVEEGMVVTYDGLGEPVVINKAVKENAINTGELKNKPFISSKAIINNETINKNTELASNVAYSNVETFEIGKVTWYYAAGKRGQSEVILDQWSAAHKTLPWWRSVRVTSSKDSNKMAVVYVLDRGPFSPGVILDIDKTRFVTDFYPLSQGWFDSVIYYYL